MLATSKQTDLLSKSDQWFEKLMHSIEADKILMDTKTADPEKAQFYHKMIDGNHREMVHSVYEMGIKYFVSEIVNEYINNLKIKKVQPLNLAFDLSDSQVLVWAEINDDDESTENILILNEAKVNAKYSDFGFSLSSTIVENGDNIPVPSHYYKLNTK